MLYQKMEVIYTTGHLSQHSDYAMGWIAKELGFDSQQGQ
jgi:hypothetical protein